MPSPTDLINGLFMWALKYGILTDDAMREASMISGDADLIPFDGSHAEFFKTRKIVKIISRSRGSTSVISLFARLPIARTKATKLKELFDDRYHEEGFSLEIDVAKPFKIDQNIKSTINPIYYHDRRIACGSSVGLGNQRNAGTLTALGKTSKEVLIGISCNHVTGGCNTARPGTPIVVPGIQDVSPENPEISVIGVHDFTGPMSQGLPQVFDISKNCDIAFFQIDDKQSQLLSSMQGSDTNAYDTPTKFANVKEGLLVQKWGRTSGHTQGEVKRIVSDPESIEYKVTSYFGPTSSQTFNGTVYFNDFFEVESIGTDPFSVSGDSGSLVVTGGKGKKIKVVGIMIGGNDSKSYVLPLKHILKVLKVRLIGSHNI
ncbi:MAG: hypothetical protein IMF09_12370 [Proteobacteria bacterium]|nr:hypothetical protein [Pseudomonadota bacterium]